MLLWGLGWQVRWRPPEAPAWHSNFSSALSLTPSTNWEWVPLVFLKINDIQSYKMYLSQPMFVYLWQLATICSGGEGSKPCFFGDVDFWKKSIFKGPGSQGRRADKWITPGASGEVGDPAYQARREKSRPHCAFSPPAFPFFPSLPFKPCFPFSVRVLTKLGKRLLKRQCGLLDLGLGPRWLSVAELWGQSSQLAHTSCTMGWLVWGWHGEEKHHTIQGIGYEEGIAWWEKCH